LKIKLIHYSAVVLTTRKEIKMYINGADLRKMRIDAGLTTVKMAKLAKVKTRKTYENWEKNIGSPSMNQFIAMCVGCNYNSSKFVKLAVDRQDPAENINVIAARR
jgi:DNA-binding XRE family transcriptional regulator